MAVEHAPQCEGCGALRSVRVLSVTMGQGQELLHCQNCGRGVAVLYPIPMEKPDITAGLPATTRMLCLFCRANPDAVTVRERDRGNDFE